MGMPDRHRIARHQHSRQSPWEPSRPAAAPSSMISRRLSPPSPPPNLSHTHTAHGTRTTHAQHPTPPLPNSPSSHAAALHRTLLTGRCPLGVQEATRQTMIEAAKTEMAEWEKQQEVQRESKVPSALPTAPPRAATRRRRAVAQQTTRASPPHPAATNAATLPPLRALTAHDLCLSSSSPGTRRPRRTGRRSRWSSRTLSARWTRRTATRGSVWSSLWRSRYGSAAFGSVGRTARGWAPLGIDCQRTNRLGTFAPTHFSNSPVQLNPSRRRRLGRASST